MSQKIAVVTGGGTGVGKAITKALVADGYEVVVTGRREAVLRDAADAIDPAHVHPIACDVADRAAVGELFAAVEKQFGRLDLLVNNAGVVDRPQRVDEMSLDRLNRMFAINVVGAFLAAREAVKRMSTRHGGKGGSIVNLGSAASKLGSPSQYVDYAASKGAIDTMTVGLALEVAAEGIRVNGIRPGIIDTDIHASGGIPDRAAQIAPNLPMKRPGTADEVAKAVKWLLSEESSYTTGAIIDVSGGRAILP